MTKRIDLPLVLLAIAGFLAPLIGGQVAVDRLDITSGADPWLGVLLGASETPTMTHALLALLCTVALGMMLLQRKILQVPNNPVGALLMVFLGLILATIGISSFKSVSIPAALEWLSFGIALYAVVGAVGRERGPFVLISSIFGGCVILGLLGLRQYGEMKAIDPTWRIFPQWVNPNAIAAMLVIGLILGLGLAIRETGRIKFVFAAGCVAIGLALFLTQSKGALVSLIASLAVFLTLLCFWLPRREIGRALGTLGATLGAVAVLALALTFQPKTGSGGHPNPGGGATAADRIINVGASADQSVGFRKLLWQSSLQLIARNPLGTGIGTFQFESTRSGLTSFTFFAHETYLQLAAEASPAAPILLVLALGFWARLLLKFGSKLQSSQNVLRACVLAAVGAIAAHSLVDSDFSYYGIGLAVFMLLGVGLLLSSDAVAPEYLPAIMRRTAAAGIALVSCSLLFFGYTELRKAQARGYIHANSTNDADNILESVRSANPWDADAWYWSSHVAHNSADVLDFAKKAVEYGPSTRNIIFLARVEASANMYSDALEALNRAFQIDPNNTRTYILLASIQAKMGDEDKRKETLKRLVAVEQTPYFKVRSLPELVATETYSARIQLAALSSDPKERVDLLQPAVDGFKQYLALTVPNVMRVAQSSDGPGQKYGDEDLESAKGKMKEAADAAKLLAEAYRTLGDTAKGDAAAADAALFAKPLDLPSAK